MLRGRRRTSSTAASCDDVEIQLTAGDTVASATAANRDWIAAQSRIIEGKTVLDVGGEATCAAQTDLSGLIEEARRVIVPGAIARPTNDRISLSPKSTTTVHIGDGEPGLTSRNRRWATGNLGTQCSIGGRRRSPT